jgi:hypothetical protein
LPSDPLASTLSAHGLSDVAAQALRAAGDDIRIRTELFGVEFAVTLDADTGVQVGSVLTGSSTRVDITPHIDSMVARRRYVLLHSHPASESCSAADASLLVLVPRIAVVVAIGEDATWYVLSLMSNRRRPSRMDIVRRHDAAFVETTQKYRALVSSEQLSPMMAWREQTHEAWTLSARQLGLRYDRVERRLGT